MSHPEVARACDYCGLPLDHEADRSPSDAADAQSSEPRYCCYGCRFAASVTQSRGEVGQSRGLMTRLGLAVFFSMNVMAFTMFLWTQDEQAAQPDRAAVAFYDVGRYVCLLFSAPVLILLGGPLVEDAWSELRRGRPSTSGLLALGVLAAFLYSVASVYRGQGHVYFEVSCMVLVAVTLGRWLEAHGKLKTTAALRALQSLLPEQVRLIRDDGEQSIARRDVVPGDRLRVLAGERIPVDGRVVRGCAAVDQQAVTGESSPIVKELGDAVYSGTLDLDGELVLEATAAADAGTLERIIEAVSRAAASRDRYQRLASRVSSWFLPIVIVIATGTLIWHWRTHDLGHALLAALAVVVIACPCALGLATPMALWASIGRAARGHVLLQDGDALARLAEARVFCFDKTGTLTTGEARVREVVVANECTSREVLTAAASLADSSTHPLSRALSDHVRGLNWTWPAAEGVRTLPGRGLAGRLHGAWGDVWVGSPRLLREQAGVATDESTRFDATDAGPEVHVAWQGRLRGVVRFDEQLRPGAVETLRWLADHGRQVVVLTGDRRARAEALSAELGVTVEGELLPQDKQSRVERLRRENSPSGGRVVMIGDGINDAPALAAADVGIALGCGTDISRHTAAVCLLGNDLASLQWLIPLAEETVRTVRWNLVWAFAYNMLGIAVAATGWLNPILAAVAMALSSLLVVTNSLRLGRGAAEFERSEVELPEVQPSDFQPSGPTPSARQPSEAQP